MQSVKPALQSKGERFDKLRVSILSLGHMTTDCYGNLVPQVLPLLKETYGISYALSGMIMAVFTVTSSLTQPVFGYYSDKHGKRWFIAASVLWTALFMPLVGVIGYVDLGASGTYWLVLVLAAMAGLGYAAFHPQAAAMVPGVSGGRKGVGVSLFSAGGNLGYALMPLIMVLILDLWGLRGVPLLIVPGLAMAGLLWKYTPEVRPRGREIKLAETIADVRGVARPLALVTGVVCARVWLFTGLITFLPLYLAAQREPPELVGVRLFVLLGSGAFGTLLGGYASDKYGRKPVIVLSLALISPLLALALLSRGILSWALLAVAGTVLLASFSPAVLIAQSLVPKNQGFASSIVLGFAFGVGGIGVLATGAIADAFGIGTGVFSLLALPFIGLAMALLLPGRALPVSQGQ